MKRGLILILILLLSLTVAQAVDVTYEVVKGDILPGDTPEYILKILNNEKYDLNVNLLQLSSVDLFRLNQENKVYTIPAGSSRNLQLTFTAQKESVPGYYGIHTVVKTQTSRLEKVLPLTVISPDESLELKFNPKAVLDPRRSVILKLDVKNKYNIDYSSLELNLQSSDFELTRKFDLARLETKTLELPVQVDRETKEGDYFAHFTVVLDGKTLMDSTIPYSIGAYQNVNELVEPETRFLYSGEAVTKTNEGNIPVQEYYSKDFSSLAYMLASFYPEPTSVNKNNGGYNVEWQFSLDPGQAKTVGYAINYRWPTLIVIVVLLVLAGWHVFRKKNAIVVTKRILAMHGESGKLHIMKVLIHVRNRGNITVKDIKVVDKVPASVSSPAKYGVYQPSKIQSVPEGTVMVWDLPAIPSGHEKLLSYVIECKQQTIERAVLPPARAKYVLFERQIVAGSATVALKGKKETI